METKKDMVVKDNNNQFEDPVSSLIVKYLREEISVDEMRDLDDWMSQSASNKKLFESLLEEKNFEKFLSRATEVDVDNAYAQFKQRVGDRANDIVQPRIINWRRISAYAASILIPLAIGVILLLQTNSVVEDETIVVEKESERTQLILSSGEKLALDQTELDTLYKDNTTLVADEGIIAYTSKNNIESEINKLIVPRGHEFQVILADGTKVWLNSESELKYPTVFNDRIRLVEVKGEAYFDVAENKEVPFVVETGGQQVRVLGTEFNVRNYKEENSITTTLVEGRVELISTDDRFEKFDLFPGEQAKLSYETMTINKKFVEVTEFISWKDGLYAFKGRDLEGVMQELARWYDLQIIYQDDEVKKQLVTGRIKRVDGYQSFIELIEKIEVAHFELNGNTITISEYN